LITPSRPRKIDLICPNGVLLFWLIISISCHHNSDRQAQCLWSLSIESASGRELLWYGPHLCKSNVKRKAQVSLARSGERALIESGCAVSHPWPLGRRSLLSSRTRHLFAASGSREPSPKIEFVFSASPETIRGEPLEFELLRTVG
jgi:hypothetical protein